MTPEAQRIAIAEACGWKIPGSPEVEELTKNWVTKGSQNHFISPSGIWCGTAGVPDYLNDLNAMHEAELLGGVVNHHAVWVDRLIEATGSRLKPPASQLFHAARATAAQRAEAFLRTIGKWTDK